MSTIGRAYGISKGDWRVGDAGFTVFGPPNGNPSPEIIARVAKTRYSRLFVQVPGMLQALETALEALRNVPQVGEVFDQQHSDTLMRAGIEINTLLRVIEAQP